MGDLGKFFFIRSQMHGKVVDIQGGCDPDAGTPCIAWEAKHEENENQLFFECPLTGTIRSKAKQHFCLDVDDDDVLVVQPMQYGDRDQAWDRADDMVINRLTGKALDIEGADESDGARILAWDIHGNINQKWVLDYQAPRYFYIVSDLNSKVMDVQGNDSSPGTSVIMWYRKDDTEDNQLWYEDTNGLIRSKLNDMALDAADGDLVLQYNEPGNQWQRWCLDSRERMIVNVEDRDAVLDIKGENDDDGAEICRWEWKDQDNQRWRFDYI